MPVRNSLIYILARILPAGLGFATTMVLTWLLTPAEYGTYGLGLAIVAMASNVFFDWLPLAFLRFHQNEQSSSILLPTFARLYAAACVCLSVIFGLAWVAGVTRGFDSLLAVSLIGACCNAAFEFTSRIQVAQFRSVHYFWMNLLRNGAILVLSSVTAYVTGSALPVLLVTSGCILIAANLYRVRIGRSDAAGFDRELARSVFRFGLPILLTMSLFGLYTSFSWVMLEALASTEAVGYFTVAYTLVNGSIGAVGFAVDLATYSVCVRALESGDRAAFKAQVEQTWSLLIGLALPASVGISLVVPNLAPLVVSPPFVPAVIQLVPWMATAILLGSIRSNFFERGLQLGHKTPQQVWIMLGAAATNIGLNYILIPRYGHVGAAVAWAAAAATSLLHSVIASLVVFPMSIPVRATAKAVLATGVMAIAVLAVPKGGGPSAVGFQVIAGLAAYTAVIFATDVMAMRKLVVHLLMRRLSR